jgi:hypothetical protein
LELAGPRTLAEPPDERDWVEYLARMAPRLGRRRFLAIAGGTLFGVGSLVAFVRTRGYDIGADREAKLLALTPWQVILLEHAARRIVAPDDPADRSIPSADDTDVVGFIDEYMARMNDPMRDDLAKLFAYVEHLAPLRCGFASRFTRLAASEQDRVLAALEASDQDLLRGGFAGLKSLVFMGYYRDPRTWKILGYAGPWVGRPARGWW